MNRKHGSVNPGRASNEAAREQLGRLRDASNSEQYWVLATDQGQFVFAVHALAGILVISGAPARELFLVDIDARGLDRARRVVTVPNGVPLAESGIELHRFLTAFTTGADWHLVVELRALASPPALRGRSDRVRVLRPRNRRGQGRVRRGAQGAPRPVPG
ncbi:unnamed protein product [Gemmata massiliana]|uniref:Uncharacterized protein n=1 Tax=Gemmata massiliana TaxID=1210884 RepID=A0A6P2D5P0_9BACT|nr:hypothetical protein [Gemmata massiliana]VTR94740.1 unnamed protein product [Gemmata massiliana]